MMVDSGWIQSIVDLCVLVFGRRVIQTNIIFAVEMVTIITLYIAKQIQTRTCRLSVAPHHGVVRSGFHSPDYYQTTDFTFNHGCFRCSPC